MYAYRNGFVNRDTVVVHESGRDIHDGVDGDGGVDGSYNEDDNECVAVFHHDNHHLCLPLSTMAIPALWCGGHGGVETADHAGTHGNAHDA